MIKVMVVEDEPPIMRQLVRLIEEYNDNFKVAATAGNGKKALELLETEPVDVVFTDIKMPVLDGLELTEQLKAKMPDTIVVIVSGYQDFQYARKAIQFHVYEYLLKPFSKEIIGNLLSKIEQEIHLKKNKEKKEKVKNSINEMNPISDDGNINFAYDSKYALFLICVGAFPLVPDDSMLPARNFWNEVNVEQILDTVLEPDENCICFAGKSAAEMVAAIELKEKDRVQRIAGDLLEKLNEKSNLAVTIVSGNEILTLNDIGSELKALRTKLYVGIKLFKSQIIVQDVGIGTAAIDMKLMAETLNFAIKTGSEQLKKCLNTLIAQFANSGLSQLQVVNFFDGLINNSTFANLKVNDYSSALKMEIYTAISNAVDINSLTDDLSFILSNIYSGENDSKIYNNQSIVEKVELYLKNNYKETITNTLLSRKFGFVPSYISKLFRNSKGMSPSEYLTSYRIDMAKKIMLEQPDLLLKEVAEMVGYEDQHYFSKIFKKETGMWPTEYRSRS